MYLATEISEGELEYGIELGLALCFLMVRCRSHQQHYKGCCLLTASYQVAAALNLSYY